MRPVLNRAGRFFFMAEDLALMFRLRATNQASPVIKSVQADVSKLAKTSTSEFSAMQQVTTSALGSITSGLSNLSGRIPIVGTAVQGLSTQVSSMAGATAEAGGEFAALGGPVGIAATAIAALGAITVIAAQQLFAITKETANFQGELFDLSQQIGVSVETLSTLDTIAATTGGNINTVTSSLAIFQKTMEAAQDPTSEEAKLLGELGVTAGDTETAFRQALKGIFALGEGAKQTATTLELFGRGGRFINAILKESEGDLDAATEKFRDLGILISTDVARASDEFNDTLEIVNRQVRSLTAQIGNEAMPVILSALQEISRLLKENQGLFANWIHDFEDAARGALRFANAIYPLVDAVTALVVVLERANLLQGTIGSIINLLQLIGQNPDIPALKIPDLVVPLRDPTLPPPTTKPKKSSKGGSTAESRDQESINLALQREAEAFRALRAELERDRDLDLKSVQEWQTASIAALQQHRTDQETILKREIDHVNQYTKKREDALLELAAIEAKRTKLNNETSEAIQKVNDEAVRRKEQSELKLNDQLLKIREAGRTSQIEALKRSVEQNEITESESLKRQIKILTESYEERKVLLTLESGQVSTSAEDKIRLDNEKLESEERYTARLKDLTQQRIDARAREIAATTPPIGGGKGVAEGDGNVFSQEELDRMGEPPSLGPWENFFNQLQELVGNVKQEMMGFSDFLAGGFRDAFLSMRDALRDGIAAWLIYGDSLGKALRMALAQSLAAIAADAAIQALYHAAFAIGKLAFGDFAGAGRHALAAAKFGAVAVLAGAGAKVVAGGAFQQGGSSGGGSSSSSGSGSTSTTSNNPTPVNRDRSVSQPTINVNVSVKRDPGSIVEVMVDNVRSNGEFRQLMLNEIG